MEDPTKQVANKTTSDTTVLRAISRAPLLRFFHWEFWVSLAAYFPVVPALAYNAIRYGSLGLMAPTAVNPGIPSSGFFGESKVDILRKLPQEYVPKYVLIPANQNARERLRQLYSFSRTFRICPPFILKPDKGEKGNGVILIQDWKQVGLLLEYFQHTKEVDLICQEHLAGNELAIFYIRHPDWSRGSIYSIATKVFPTVVGDGKRTLSELIISHPRYKLQADIFLTRHASRLSWIPQSGYTFQLTYLGNHCKGTMCLDGSHLITPALTAQIDNIAKKFDGFYFGRFDLKYDGNNERLQEGKSALKIFELNGVTSELLNVYDPSMGFRQRYALLFRQWVLAFQIGRRNQEKGANITPYSQLRKECSEHFEMVSRYPQL